MTPPKNVVAEGIAPRKCDPFFSFARLSFATKGNSAQSPNYPHGYSNVAVLLSCIAGSINRCVEFRKHLPGCLGWIKE